VVALVTFLLVGAYFVVFGTPVPGQETGFSLITDNGGWLPNGLLPAIIIIQGVLFAYAGIELIGTTAGETANPEKVIPKAIRTVILPRGALLAERRPVFHRPDPAFHVHGPVRHQNSRDE